MPLRIALTGATGFVGKALLPLLLEAGHNVVVLVRSPDRATFDERVSVVAGDLNDTSALNQLTKNADAVLHVAGVVAGVRRQDFFNPNVDGTIALADAALRNTVKQFVFVSSLAAREPLLNDYAASKAAAESALQKYTAKMRVTILRPAAVYGPGDTATLPLLKSLMSKLAILPGTATAQFSMVHVQDVARALVDAVSSQHVGTYEIDDGQRGHTWSEVAAVVKREFGCPSRVFYLPQSIAMLLGRVGDIVGKLRGKPSLLNSGQLAQIYHPDWCVKGNVWPLENTTPLEKGLPETIRWYQAKGLLPLRDTADRRPSQQDTTG